MSGRSSRGDLANKIIRKVGKANLVAGAEEQIKKFVPEQKCVMNRAKRGIFAGKHIQFGNQVSEDGGNKTRRSWKPNIQEKKLFSYVLDRHIQVKVTVHALRCIDKAGGIDEYLLKTPYKKLDNEMAVAWKARIQKMYEDLGPAGLRLFVPKEEKKLEEGSTESHPHEEAAAMN